VIVVLVEQVDGRPDLTSLEALALARGVAAATGDALHAAVIGPGGSAAGPALAAQGVDTVHVIEHPGLTDYAPVAWGVALAGLVASAAPAAVIASGTERGAEVTAHLAARLGLPLAANCIDVRASAGAGPWEITRQRWGGSLLEDARLDGRTRLLTVAPHAVAAEEGATPGRGAVQPFAPALGDRDLAVRVVRRVAPETGKVSLADAKVVVGGGRGVGSAEGFAPIVELASLLGGAVGVSRAVTSAGWRPHAEQVGQTGLRIAPELYIACGISGAIQHMVGARTAKRILAINTDAEAPMVTQATYAVIGDLHAVVPAINAEIRRTTGG
jgi:electron transfer flavoprotein alpha subunit